MFLYKEIRPDPKSCMIHYYFIQNYLKLFCKEDIRAGPLSIQSGKTLITVDIASAILFVEYSYYI